MIYDSLDIFLKPTHQAKCVVQPNDVLFIALVATKLAIIENPTYKYSECQRCKKKNKPIDKSKFLHGRYLTMLIVFYFNYYYIYY